MKVMRISDSGQRSVLTADDVPRPQPGRGELLIQIHAAGVTPTELLWYPTTHDKKGEKRSGAVPGHEFSGVVTAIGEAAAGFAIGDAIYGMNDWFAEGAMAEFCIAEPGGLAAKPKRLTHTEAAAVPIGALTAWQGLFDRAQLQTGQHVLVHGGAGAVGTFAIQLARSRGAHVTATASARNVEFLSQLGAETVIDYRAARFEEVIADVDIVFDAVGGETLQRSWALLKPGGRMITIAADGETTQDERVKRAYFIVEPNHEQLEQISAMLDAGNLRPFVDAVLPLEQAAAAYAGEVRSKIGRGKMVVAIAPGS
jgi:NADPH:quinone reductase-like Zn-dependent oxidoreductase